MKERLVWVVVLIAWVQVLSSTGVLAKTADSSNYESINLQDLIIPPEDTNVDAPDGAGHAGSSNIAEAETAPSDNLKDKNIEKKDGIKSPDSKLSTTSMSLSSVPGGSDGNLSQSLLSNFQVDPYSGAGTIQLPLYTPPGRAGLQPALTLTYSPQNGNGLLGYGWKIDFPAVDVSTKDGVPTYDANTKYYANVGGKLELVKTGSNSYNSRFFNPELSEFKLINDTWQVRDKTGKLFVFGLEDHLSDDSKICDPDDSSHCYRYLLSKVKDVHGNYSFFRHFSDGSFEILYTGEPGTDTDLLSAGTQNFQVRIEGEIQSLDRKDPVLSYRSGFEMKINERLKQISVFAGGELQKKYVFNYHNSPRTHRTLLNKITEYGADGITALPPITFTYEDEEAYSYDMQTPTFSLGQPDWQIFTGDFNGDGHMDFGNYTPLIGRIKISTWGCQVYHPAIPKITNEFCFEDIWIDSYGNNGTVLSGDFNADGKTDISLYINGKWKVAFSDGVSFIDQGTWATGLTSQASPSTGDFDGDGNSDAVAFFKEGGYWKAKIALNKNRNGFETITKTFKVGPASFSMPFTTDFNGDGLSDFGCFDKNTTADWLVKLNTGDLTAEFRDLDNRLFNFCPGDRAPFITDITGDGLSDIACWDRYNKFISYLTSNSLKFGATRILDPGFTIGEAGSKMIAADFNGDGINDYIVYDNPENVEIAYSNGKFADLLVSTNNGIGGETSIEYRSSTNCQNIYMPMILPIVASTTASNSLGDSYTTRYSIGYGLWDASEREFYGFGYLKVTDPEGNYSQATFHQDNVYLKGKPIEQSRHGSPYGLYSKKVNTWKVQDINTSVNPPIKFTYLERTDNYIHDGYSAGFRTAQQFFYEETPQSGNLTKVVQLGWVDSETGEDIYEDSRSIETEYIENTGSADVWLKGLPNEVIVKNYAGETMRKTWFYYDNSTDLNSTPIKGLLTKKVHWAGDQPNTVHPETLYGYDAYGNLETTTDPLNSSTTITYDSQFHMFPTVTENALGHQITNEYYGIEGVLTDDGGYYGLWGQLKTTTDPNNQQSQSIYDVFGRMVKSISPLDSLTYPTTLTEYEINPTYTKVTQKQRVEHGQSKTIDVVSFSDGLGRLIQKKSKSATPGQYIVNSQVEYNSRGLPEKQYMPRFTTNALDVMDAVDPAKPHTMHQYDPLGRVTNRINPDGSFASFYYMRANVAALNENGHAQQSVFDAYGRLIAKGEYLGADGRSPHYPQSDQPLYASTYYYYDSEGNLIETKDAHNNVTTITYDKLGRKISMDDPDMGLWQYGYDLNGNLSWQMDAKGQRIDFTYDALNRLIRKSDGGDIDVEYIYDDPLVSYSKGRLTQVNYNGMYGSQDKTTFTYDALGREIKSVKTIEGINYPVERKYNALNSLTEVKYPDGKTTYYDYNDVGQIKGVANDKALFDQQSRLDVWDVLKGKVVGIAHWCEENLLGIKPAYAQSSEMHWVEAEDADSLISPLTIGQDSGASGNEYIYTPNNRKNYWAFHNKTATYTVTIAQAGEYIFWGRIVAPSSKDNSFYVQVDSGNNNVWNLPTGSSWQWDQVEYSFWGGPIRFNLSPGTHTIKIKAKEDGAMIDKFLLTNDLNYTPSGLGGDDEPPPPPPSPPDAPVLNSATAGNSQVDLSWSAASGAQGYYVKYGTQSGVYSDTINVGDVTSHSVNGLTNGTTYYFAVSAFNADGESAHSNEKSATPQGQPPAAPDLISAVGGEGQVDLSWSTVSGANDYNVKYGVQSGIYADTINVGDSTSDTITGLQNGTTYYFAVSAFNDSGESANSNEKSATPQGQAPNAPILYSAGAGQEQVDLLWSTVSDADGYYVKYGTQSGQYDQVIDAGAWFMHTVTGLQGGTEYYFVINAYNQNGESPVSNERSATPVAPPPPNPPTLDSAEAGDGQVELHWSSVTDAYGYYIKYGTQSGNYDSQIDAGDITDYIITGLQNGTTYYFALSTYNQNGESVDSNEMSAMPTSPPPGIPVLTGSQSGDGYIDLTWSSADRADGYIVKYGTQPGVYEFTSDAGIATEYRVSNLENETKYYFVIVAYNTGGESDDSNEQRAIPIGPVLFASNIEYNAAGQMTRVEYDNGVVTTYEYNDLNLRLERMSSMDSQSQVLQDLNYSYDSSGNIIEIIDNVNTASQTFAYDSVNRLVEASGYQYGTKYYEYDEIGNILSKDGVQYYYGENGAGPHAVTSLDNGSSFDYDANGNMVSRSQGGELTEYVFDVENRLKRVIKNSGTIAEFEYDGDGGRTRKVTPLHSSVFIGSLFEINNSKPARHVFLGSTRLAARINGELAYYHNDHLGGINVITDHQGVQKELVEYEPYGQKSRSEKSGGGAGDQLAWHYFTGQRLDDETGLYYYGARYYDPVIGRFITPDTIVQAPDNPQTLNRYTYCNNNPVNNIDPTGYGWFSKVWKTIVGAFVGGLVTALTGGAGAPLAAAMFYGGVVGGAVSGALNNGWKGALVGAGIGGVSGFGIGWGIAEWGSPFAYSVLAAGAGISYATSGTDGLEHFGAGLFGGFLGSQTGNGIIAVGNDGISYRNPHDAEGNLIEPNGWDVRGVGTTGKIAQKIANQTGKRIFFIESRGHLSDLVRAGIQKFYSKGLAAREFAEFLKTSQGMTINAHSEGTLTTARAIQALSAEGIKIDGSKINFNAPVISRTTAANLTSSIGAKFDYSLNWFDPIGIFTTLDPVKVGIYGGFGSATLAIFHGGKYYGID